MERHICWTGNTISALIVVFLILTEFDEPGEICLDVTDGQSNGPQNMCRNVQCLYDLEELGVKLTVYAFGVGEYNVDELRCITRPDPLENRIFQLESFDEFAIAINTIAQVNHNLARPSLDLHLPLELYLIVSQLTIWPQMACIPTTAASKTESHVLAHCTCFQA